MITYIIIGVIALLLIVLVSSSYVKAPPSYAFIISGLNKEPRVLIGRGGFRVPGLERLDKVYLGQITIDVKTEEDVPTQDFINVSYDICIDFILFRTRIHDCDNLIMRISFFSIKNNRIQNTFINTNFCKFIIICVFRFKNIRKKSHNFT